MKKNILLLFIFGIAAGFLSFLSFSVSLSGHSDYSQILGYGPGFIFGVIISCLLYFLYRKNVYLHLLYIAISIFAFYIAITSFLFLNDGNDSVKPLFIAGLLGSSILVAGLRLIYPISPKYIAIIITAGIIAGLPIQELGIFYFPVWQAVVAVAIGFAIDDNMKSRNNLINSA